MTDARRAALLTLIRNAGLPNPERLDEATDHVSVAVGLRIRDVIETIEACGSTDGEVVADLVKQFRELRPPHD